MQYKFSVPMPDNVEEIIKLYDINKEIEKSKIQNLYFALPSSCPDNTGFEQLRTRKNTIEKLEDYIPHIEKSLELDFDFIYLLNSPKPFLIGSKFFDIQLEKLDILINRLAKLGCYKYRVSNAQLISYLEKYYPNVEVYASTSFEFKSIKQYSNLIEIYKNIVEIVPACDLNKNFLLLKSLKEQYPEIVIELMVNEGCINSCPLRYLHNLSIPYIKSQEKLTDPDLTFAYFTKTCNNFALKNPYYHLCNPNIIYPWEIEEYSKIGINNFKLVGRNEDKSICSLYIDYYKTYLKGIDSIKNIENVPIRIFNHYLKGEDFEHTVKQVKDLLPSIEHFKTQGHLCASICGVACNYCEECAKKIENLKL